MQIDTWRLLVGQLLYFMQVYLFFWTERASTDTAITTWQLLVGCLVVMLFTDANSARPGSHVFWRTVTGRDPRKAKNGGKF